MIPLRTLFLALLLIISATPVATPVATPTAYDPASLLAIKPESRAEIAAALPAGMPEYTITATFPDLTAAEKTITGEMTLRYTNTTGVSLANIPLRLWANRIAPNHDAITLGSVTVDGVAAAVELSESDTVATIPFAAPLEAGGVADIDVAFRITVQPDDNGYYGMFNYATETESWALAHWYPMLAGRDPDRGWVLDPTSSYGDPVFSDTGMYDVTTVAPESFTLITSGVEVEASTADGLTTTHWNAKPSRDFVIMASPNLESSTTTVDGTEIISWSTPDHRVGREDALKWTAESLEIFNPLLGEYPYQQLNVSEALLHEASGVEYPQFFVVRADYYLMHATDQNRMFFQFTVAHEVVHMWFYNVVGNNQYDHAFIDESLTNFLSSVIYFTRASDAQTAAAIYDIAIAQPFAWAVEGNSDMIVDYSTDAFPSPGQYSTAAYSKGAVGFRAIYDAMGHDAFFAGLRDYVHDFRFRVATPDDLRNALAAQTTIDLPELWRHWFERREGAQDIGVETSTPNP